jgi:hypothetical protein
MFTYRDTRRLLTLAALALLALTGCGAPKTYPVQGKVVFDGGNLQQLAGGSVELVHNSDRSVRAYGTIQPDGTFVLQTLYQGEQLPGALEGTYQARVVLAGDGDLPPGSVAVDPSYLDFHSSGLTFRVPSDSDLTIKVLPKGAAGTPRVVPRPRDFGE